MIGITIIGIIWAILSITTGNDVGFGVIMITICVVSFSVGCWIAIKSNKNND